MIGGRDIGDVYFGQNHSMKPHRLCMTHYWFAEGNLGMFLFGELRNLVILFLSFLYL